MMINQRDVSKILGGSFTLAHPIILMSDQKFCSCDWQFYKPINIQEIVAWINSGMSYL